MKQMNSATLKAAVTPYGDLIAPDDPKAPLAVRVPLHGSEHPGERGFPLKGRCVTLDFTDWDRIRRVCSRWYLLPGPLQPIQAPRKPGGRKPQSTRLVLARMVTQAKPYQVVRWRSSDRLDLRRTNLMLMDTNTERAVPA